MTTGLSERDLLDLFDRCEAYPGIRAAIRAVLFPNESSGPGIRTRIAEAVERTVGAGGDPYQWLHDNDFSWDDVNAIAAILDAGGFAITLPEVADAEARR